MANSNGWGDGAANNAIGWGQGANNAISWGKSHSLSSAGLTDIVGVTTDSDAQAFITAAAITDSTQQAAINTLVLDLKSNGVWTKMKGLWPMVGGTASQHKFNLKDPRDLDAAYRLVFNGGWTHSSNGATPNGTNAFADTKLNPLTVLSNNINIGYYSRTNQNALVIACDIGSTSGPSGPDYLMLFPRVTNVTWYSVLESGTYTQVADTNSAAFYIASRNGTTVKGFKNGSNVITRTGITVQTRPNGSVYLGASNWHGLATAGWYSSRQCALAFIADDLTDTEAVNCSTAVQTFQTTLGRNV
jgi:hypothetical protein